ncbi:uncharacterized protein LOC125723637 [Brienomyrus brachyistius]|uniref:uncharacterized protein LOC125723637 n=1 Tax=Brienomyrus brachyistius TaxID=42636 RepID=UPI0020B3AF99|nr:uncharacterized protein LOC125723637 [Brienomyrus brachyistius]
MTDFTGGKGQPPPYNKCWTLPRQHVSHMHQDKRYTSDFWHAPAFQQQQTCTQNFSRDCDEWAAPGSGMGGVLRDHTNWTEQPVSCTAGALNGESHCKGYSEYQKQGMEWRKTEIERVRKKQISESRRQIEEWRKRWERKTPPDYKAGVKANRSSASHHKLEAWTDRYSQSPPRKKDMDARIWGSVQGVQDRLKIPDRISRAGSNDTQRIFHSSEQYNHIRGWEQRYHGQLMVPHTLPQSPVLGKNWRKDRKENNPCLQQRVFNQPPCYIPPPPYRAPHTIKHQEYAYKYPTLPVSRKQEFYGGLQKEREGYEKWKRTKWMDIDFSQGEVGRRTWEDPMAALKLLPECFAQLVSSKHSEMMAEPGKVVSTPSLASSRTTFKKNRGGETLFCPVSQSRGVARLTASPKEHLQSSLQRLSDAPLTQKENVGTDISKRGWIESIGGSQTEVDSGMIQSKQPNKPLTFTANQTSHLNVNRDSRQYSAPSWLQNKPVTSYREDLVGVVQGRPKNIAGKKKNPSDRDEALVMGSKVHVPPVMKKETQQPCNPTSREFPLWKEPSRMTRPRNVSSIQCIKSNLERQSEVDHYEKQRDNSRFINKHMAKEKGGTASNRGDGILVIDATCVVVRAEFIPSPKKEQVQYIYPPEGKNYEVCRGPSSAISQLDLDISQRNIIMQRGTDVSPEILLEEPKSEDDQKCINELPQSNGDAGMEDVRKTSLLSSAAFENGSLVERPLRIVGGTVHKPNTNHEASSQPAVVGLSNASVYMQPGPSPPQARSSSLYPSDSFEGTDSIFGDQFLSDLDGAAALGQNPRISKEKQLNDMGHSMPHVSEKSPVINHVEKQDILVTENMYSEESLPIPHTKQEMSHHKEDIPFSPPRFHSVSSQLLPSVSYSLSPSLSHTPPYLNLESLSDFPTLSLDTTDTDSISLPPPLCHPITISPNSERRVAASSQSPESHALPCSLWDAVSRIRRHTAPDSENEEEEAGETWNNQGNMKKEAELKGTLFAQGSRQEVDKCSEKKNASQRQEDLDLVENGSHRRSRDQDKEPVPADGASGLQVAENVSLSEKTGLKDIERYENELQRQCEDDTQSWSSSDSHTSTGTVITGQEIQAISEEMMPKARDCVSWMEAIGSPTSTA